MKQNADVYVCVCVCVCEQTGTAEHTTNCVKSLCDWNKTIVIEGPSTNFNWGEGRGGGPAPLIAL